MFKKSLCFMLTATMLCSLMPYSVTDVKAANNTVKTVGSSEPSSEPSSFDVVASKLDLTSIEDASVKETEKFTHKEWMGIDYKDPKGVTVKGPEVDAINVKAASITSTSHVSYDSLASAITGASDYQKEASSYVQFLAGKEDSVKDWSLAVVKNQTEAQAADYPEKEAVALALKIVNAQPLYFLFLAL